MDLQTQIDRELEEAGFGKVAYNPFTVADHGRPAPGSRDAARPAKTDGSSSARHVAGDVPSDAEVSTRLQDSGSAKVTYRNPVASLKEAAKRMPMQQLIRKIARDKAGSSLGLASGNEVHQAFTSSEALNRIKLAGMASALANLLPEELFLPVVRKFKGTNIFPQAADVEAFLLGKGLRGAAEAQDLAKARRLFEGAGGVPHIDASELAALKMKADALDASRINPMGQTMMGLGLGGLAGTGLGAYLAHQQQPAQEVQPQ